jgi:hypothetical protein
MIQDGIGYTVTNSTGGQSLQVDAVGVYKETLPFFVFEDTNAAGATVFRVNPGTFNNSLPEIGGLDISNAEASLPPPSSDSFVVLAIPASDDAFPDGQPAIVTLSSIPANTGAQAYFGLARIKVETLEGGAVAYTVESLASGSLWGERFRYGDKLEYWFSRV